MYRKYKPTLIFSGTEMMPAESVLITETDGTIREIVAEKDAGEDLQILDGILSPGFVNAHCHIELSHMKGLIPPNTGLVNFVQQVMTNRDRIPPEEKQAAMEKAEIELYQSGTVAIGDICNGADSIALKQKSPLYWHNFIEVSGFIDAVAEKRLSAAEQILALFTTNENHSTSKRKPGGQHLATLSPHAPYSVSKELFRLLNEKTARQTISIHSQEAMAENELYQHKTGHFLDLYKNFGIDISGFSAPGRTSFQSWLPYFTNGQQIISVHNTFISEEDLSWAKNQKSNVNTARPYEVSGIHHLPAGRQGSPFTIHYCICPNANQYIENALPPVGLLLQNNCDIVMGTDSYASNWQLNMMEEINSIRKHFPKIALPVILRWATLNGARALGIEDRFGSFEKGKKPGLVLIFETKNAEQAKSVKIA